MYGKQHGKAFTKGHFEFIVGIAFETDDVLDGTSSKDIKAQALEV